MHIYLFVQKGIKFIWMELTENLEFNIGKLD